MWYWLSSCDNKDKDKEMVDMYMMDMDMVDNNMVDTDMVDTGVYIFQQSCKMSIFWHRSFLSN